MTSTRLGLADLGGLHALLALLGDEGDALALLEGLEAVLLLRAMVVSDGFFDEEDGSDQCLPRWRGSGRRGLRSRSPE